MEKVKEKKKNQFIMLFYLSFNLFLLYKEEIR